ncbi:hypothetical protein PMI04_015840 [Sphingobium sp. AP49]|uniref:hypothetical protein n=1 Tax=Sphingobium sp. AP49 TaxID=1144307 RepID=UPI00026ED916|nr:hypothetical protein [Sphingobium sp. AP49]WHO38020.1 hypothetical protein PMI04_015840 [Sphingobium sp. AP49]
MTKSEIVAGISHAGNMPLPSGRTALTLCGVEGERAFSSTAVVAGLKADPVSLLDGGPSGAIAHNRATRIVVHRAAIKGSLPFTSLPLDALDAMPIYPLAR